MSLRECNADLMRQLIVAGARWVAVNKDELNDLNVFPVPDGDTGTNLYLTMRSLVSHMKGAKGDEPIGVLLARAARGCLLGARGNSGVIFSQIFGGFARALKMHTIAEAPDFARALCASAHAAYESVADPREGTILTVIRLTADAAEEKAHHHPELAHFLQEISHVSRQTLNDCSGQLEVLRQAGVVDAGGLGLVYFLEGMLKAAQQNVRMAKRSPQGAPAAARAGAREFHTFCTEFLLHAQRSVDGALREALSPLGDCLLVIQQDDIVKVHIHTDDPSRVRSILAGAGAIAEEKIENMKLQHRHLLEAAQDEPQRDRICSLLAICQGEGLQQYFQKACCSSIPGGQSMNPSVEEILRSIESAEGSEVLLFANNANCVEACRIAGSLAARRVEVIDTTNPAEAVALVQYCDPFLSLEENLEQLQAKKDLVTSFEISRAVRDAAIGERTIREGQWMLISEGGILEAADALDALLHEMTRRERARPVKSCALIAGSDFPLDRKEDVHRIVDAAFPGADVLFLDGGQPHYPLLVALERGR